MSLPPPSSRALNVRMQARKPRASRPRASMANANGETQPATTTTKPTKHRDRRLSSEALDHRMSKLSVSAPVFTPKQNSLSMASSLTAPTASWMAKTKARKTDGRSTETARGRTSERQRPRRTRIGAMGFSKTTTTRRTNAPTTTNLNAAARGADDAAPVSTSVPQRRRSESVGSESDDGSDDEVFPEDTASAPASAFPVRLNLLSQQKKIIPKQFVQRESVIDTIFAALFTRDRERERPHAAGRRSAFGDDDTGTDTDEPNEDFVKRGLAAALFKDGLSGRIELGRRQGALTDREAIDRFITPEFIHMLVNGMRFEDFRTASARIDILRAIHRSCPTKRIHIARALADASLLRLQYVEALAGQAQACEVDKQKVMVKHPYDHSHSLTELLRFAIENTSEWVDGVTGDVHEGGSISQPQANELVRNYLSALMSLWKSHWFDPAGCDDEELISCAGQFVAYMPQVAIELLHRLLGQWPTRFPKEEVIAIRIVARVIMTSPPLPSLEPNTRLPVRVFTRLARCLRSPHIQVSSEALAFTGCQFVMVHFLGQYDDIYELVTAALHENAVSHIICRQVSKASQAGDSDCWIESNPSFQD